MKPRYKAAKFHDQSADPVWDGILDSGHQNSRNICYNRHTPYNIFWSIELLTNLVDLWKNTKYIFNFYIPFFESKI